MGRAVLAYQFVAGLTPVLRTKVAGMEGSFEQLLVKAQFEKAKEETWLLYRGEDRRLPPEMPVTKGGVILILEEEDKVEVDNHNRPSWSDLVLDQVIIDVLFAKELGILPGIAHPEEEAHQWRLEEQVRFQQEVVLTGLPVLQQQTYKRTV